MSRRKTREFSPQIIVNIILKPRCISDSPSQKCAVKYTFASEMDLQSRNVYVSWRRWRKKFFHPFWNRFDCFARMSQNFWKHYMSKAVPFGNLRKWCATSAIRFCFITRFCSILTPIGQQSKRYQKGFFFQERERSSQNNLWSVEFGQAVC